MGRWRSSLVLLVALALVTAACGGDDGDGTEEAAEVDQPGTTVVEDEGEPQPGGTVVMGLEAETNGQATHIQNALAGGYMINCWRMGGQTDPYITLSNAFGPPDQQQPLNFTNFHDDTVAEQPEIMRTSTDFDARYRGRRGCTSPSRSRTCGPAAP